MNIIEAAFSAFLSLHIYTWILLTSTRYCFKVSVSQSGLSSSLPSLIWMIVLKTWCNLTPYGLWRWLFRATSYLKWACLYGTSSHKKIRFPSIGVAISNAELTCHSILQNSDWRECKDFELGGVTAGFVGRTELCRNKAAGWKNQKAQKSFNIVFCRVHSNFCDWTIPIDRRASGQLSKLHTIIQDHSLYGLLSL